MIFQCMSQCKGKVLAIEAHPDDLVFFYGGTIAKLVDDGYRVKVITLTTGDQSTVNPRFTRREIEAIMHREHATAMEIMGITDQEYLEGFTNHFIFDGAQEMKVREILIRKIREFKPDTVITFDIADSHEENPDHRLLARVGLQAASFAAYPLVHPEQLEEGLEPHFVARVLLTPTREPNLFVDISGSPLEKKIKAGAAYSSQLELMVTEMEKRLETIGLNPDLDDISYEELWETVCESMAGDTAKEARAFHEIHQDIAPRIKPEHAEAFRMQYLGAVEKIRDFLPKRCLVL
ncbi:hypothetical protein GF325_01040 [Candidatus Bathyarchaeota archaeon]|nr:hypothetical protein [Candidatus Bathyarchaeota archaeon]